MTAYAASGLSYQVTKGECYITGRGTETGSTLVIPATINGYKVKGIKEMAFYNGTFTSVTIENGVEAVSYTHLDVYKRQRKRRCQSCWNYKIKQ